MTVDGADTRGYRGRAGVVDGVCWKGVPLRVDTAVQDLDRRVTSEANLAKHSVGSLAGYSHDDIELLSSALVVYRDVVSPLHSNGDFQPMSDRHIGLVMLARTFQRTGTIRDLKIPLQVPRSHGIQQLGIHPIRVFGIDLVWRRVVGSCLSRERGEGRLFGRIRTFRHDG